MDSANKMAEAVNFTHPNWDDITNNFLRSWCYSSVSGSLKCV